MRKSGEDYLEIILILSKSNPELHAIDIARELNYTKPSITRAMGLLKANGFIEIDGMNHIKLTDKGRQKADEIYERHKYITKFWILNGVSAETAEKDACIMEHEISGETFEFIKNFVLSREN